MYKVVTPQKIQNAKSGLSSTGMKAASSVRRSMNRYSHDKNSVLANSKNSAKKVAVYVVQIVLWIVDSDCSKHMTGDRSLLINFIEKFMGTVRFGNDIFVAITGYDDYIQGNLTICHVYYVEGLRRNLFSVGQFCDGDLEVAFRSKTYYVRNLEADDLLTGGRKSNLYTISIYDMAASSLVCLMSKATSTKSWLWHRRLSHLNFVATACFTQNWSIIHTRYNKTPYELLRGRKLNLEYFHVFGSLCYPTNDCDDLGKMKPKAYIGVLIEPKLQRFNNINSSAEPMNTPSKEDLDNLFGLMFEEYFGKKSSDTLINFTAQLTQLHEDLPFTSSINIEEHEAPPINYI
nr:integrase, catalytic region, zinc finger, CCHC-type, peptidase aspartic, catalytic [Tanacetum cinerariifolium]